LLTQLFHLPWQCAEMRIAKSTNQDKSSCFKVIQRKEWTVIFTGTVLFKEKVLLCSYIIDSWVI
jgi:hypothetical protein